MVRILAGYDLEAFLLVRKVVILLGDLEGGFHGLGSVANKAGSRQLAGVDGG